MGHEADNLLTLKICEATQLPLTPSWNA